jgi:alkylmercury lyase
MDITRAPPPGLSTRGTCPAANRRGARPVQTQVIRVGDTHVNDTLVDQLLWAAFDRLRSNRPATPADLAADLECTAEIVAEILAAQAALGRVEVDVDGVVVGSHGLTLVPTRHALTIDEAELHTWCAFDAVGIPAAAGEDARVATRCGWCERPLAVAIAAGVPVDDGSRVVLWLPTGPCDDLRRQFCAHANLFCDREHLDRWLAQADEPSGRVLTLAETAELGRQSWRRPAPVALTTVRGRGRRGRA